MKQTKEFQALMRKVMEEQLAFNRVLGKADAMTRSERIAADVDAGVFGAAEPTPEAGVAVWAAVDGAVATINGQLGPWRRIRGFCSIRSLRGRPGTSRVRGLLRRVLPRKDPR